jgi:hypothetical protein
VHALCTGVSRMTPVSQKDKSVVRVTGELGVTVEYLYWSSRRTGRFLEDNNLVAQPVTRTITSPAIRLFPTFSRSTTSSDSLRPEVAKTIERALGQIAVTRFNAPSEIKYAKGTSTVVFGEFKTFEVKHERQPAVMFTVMDYNKRDRESVAICLFGSMDNFLEYVQSTGPGFDGGPWSEGWVSSSAPAVYNFIASHGKQFDHLYFGPKEVAMAVEALKIADGQGMYSGNAGLGTEKPWQRAFTYGDARKAQWLAQIYLDVDLLAAGRDREGGIRRILIGAPLWIRTPDPHAIRLYATSDDPEVVVDRQIEAMRTVTSADRAFPLAVLDRSEDTSGVGVAKVQADGELQREYSAWPTVPLPYPIYEKLKDGFIASMANWAINNVAIDARYRIPSLGGSFSTVFSWVWSNDRDEAMILLADYLAHLRESNIDPPISLEEVLEALRPTLSWRFADYNEVLTMAHQKVRKYYGADPNE